MSKKVLVISGSPRKEGNSDILCDMFLKGALEAGHIAHKVQIADKTVNPCIACYACRGKGKCFQEDDGNAIVNQMVDAHVIVLATPIYFYAMDGQMKTLIDRTLPRYTEITDKEFYFIATAATQSIPQFDRTFDGFTAFLDCLDGAEEKGRLYGTGVYKPGEVNETDLLQQAFEMGKAI